MEGLWTICTSVSWLHERTTRFTLHHGSSLSERSWPSAVVSSPRGRTGGRTGRSCRSCSPSRGGTRLNQSVGREGGRKKDVAHTTLSHPSTQEGPFHTFSILFQTQPTQPPLMLSYPLTSCGLGHRACSSCLPHDVLCCPLRAMLHSRAPPPSPYEASVAEGWP